MHFSPPVDSRLIARALAAAKKYPNGRRARLNRDWQIQAAAAGRRYILFSHARVISYTAERAYYCSSNTRSDFPSDCQRDFPAT